MPSPANANQRSESATNSHNSVDPDQAIKPYLEQGGLATRAANTVGKYVGKTASSWCANSDDDTTHTNSNTASLYDTAVSTGAKALNVLNEARSEVIGKGGKQLEDAAENSSVPLAHFAAKKAVSAANGFVNTTVATPAAFAMGAASSISSPTSKND